MQVYVSVQRKAFIRKLTKAPNFKNVITAVIEIVTFLITVAKGEAKCIKVQNATVSS